MTISGGGCSGLQYGMKLENEKAEDDWELEVEGVKVLVNPMTMPMIDNVTVDFVNTLTQTGFKFNNPNVQRPVFLRLFVLGLRGKHVGILRQGSRTLLQPAQFRPAGRSQRHR